MIKSIIDIGSNSIKMRVAEVINDKIRVIRDETEVVRLGRGLGTESSSLNQNSMKISCETVSRMVKRSERLGAKIFIVGTMALRIAENSSEFLKMVKDSTGYEVHVISGEDEAKYSWLGAVDGFNVEGDVIMFDSGGGSTEFVCGSNGNVKKIVSVPVGAVNLSERFFYEHDKPIRKILCDEAIKHVENLLTANKINEFKADNVHIIGVGGGIITMAGVKFACENFMPSKLHGSVLTQRDAVRQIQMYSSLTLKERENIIGLPASRADVILGSACIILTVLRIFNSTSCIVSINGLRHGLLLSDNIV